MYVEYSRVSCWMRVAEQLRRSFLAGKCIAVADWMQCRRNAEPAAVAIIATAEAKKIKPSSPQMISQA